MRLAMMLLALAGCLVALGVSLAGLLAALRGEPR